MYYEMNNSFTAKTTAVRREYYICLFTLHDLRTAVTCCDTWELLLYCCRQQDVKAVKQTMYG